MDADQLELSTPAKPDRTLRAILIAVALLVVIAVVVVVVRNATTVVLDPATPEGVVQRYSQAVIDGDHPTAYSLLSADSRHPCDYYDPAPTGIRLALRSTTLSGTTNALVRVTISKSYNGGPFSSNEDSYDDEFILVKSGGTWLIYSAPYDFTTCAWTGS
jgi:hypothetical protein